MTLSSRAADRTEVRHASVYLAPLIDPSHARRARCLANVSWRRRAISQLESIDEDIEEEGLGPPSPVARDLARSFIHEFSTMGLPEPSVFADENRSVSIQMETSGFAFLLTCSEEGRGVYNIADRTPGSIISLEASYKILCLEEIRESALFEQLLCLIEPLKNHARHTD